MKRPKNTKTKLIEKRAISNSISAHDDHSTKELQQATRTRITIKRPTFPAVNTSITSP